MERAGESFCRGMDGKEERKNKTKREREREREYPTRRRHLLNRKSSPSICFIAINVFKMALTQREADIQVSY